MIDKRLLNIVPKAKKFVWLTVLLRTLLLFSNTVMIFAVSKLLASKGENALFPVLVIACALCAIVLLNIASAYTTYCASRDVKTTLRVRIYEKLLRLGTAYQEKNATAKIIQLAVEGVETLETWFGAFLPLAFKMRIVYESKTFCVMCIARARFFCVQYGR